MATPSPTGFLHWNPQGTKIKEGYASYKTLSCSYTDFPLGFLGSHIWFVATLSELQGILRNEPLILQRISAIAQAPRFHFCEDTASFPPISWPCNFWAIQPNTRVGLLCFYKVGRWGISRHKWIQFITEDVRDAMAFMGSPHQFGMPSVRS